MGPAKPNQSDARARLHEAALRVVVRDRPDASVRAIAKEAGLSEGALYRHYSSREELLGAVFAEQVEPMIAHKEALVAMRAPIEDRLREWVRSTYDRFDRDPDGFAYVFLTPHNLPEKYLKYAGRQSGLLIELFRQGREEGKLRDLPVELAASMFVGLLLGVPERIKHGVMPGPSLMYTDEVAGAIWRCLAVNTDTPAPGADV
ncbi:MAG: TetR/AcrR family transcriptional regulator [Phycisphaerales bacterium]|nr:TetR/AcrR family transcriptional regulator [Phycisphaerales bacterium]MCB9837379.1 TetR/AcrR family transcriptional regulator [Phycisphaera sp.]